MLLGKARIVFIIATAIFNVHAFIVRHCLDQLDPVQLIVAVVIVLSLIIFILIIFLKILLEVVKLELIGRHVLRVLVANLRLQMLEHVLTLVFVVGIEL